MIRLVHFVFLNYEGHLVAAQHPMCLFSIGTYSDQVADKQVPGSSGPGKVCLKEMEKENRALKDNMALHESRVSCYYLYHCCYTL